MSQRTRTCAADEEVVGEIDRATSAFNEDGSAAPSIATDPHFVRSIQDATGADCQRAVSIFTDVGLTRGLRESRTCTGYRDLAG